MIAPLCFDLKADAFTLSCTQTDEMNRASNAGYAVVSFVMPQVLVQGS